MGTKTALTMSVAAQDSVQEGAEDTAPGSTVAETAPAPLISATGTAAWVGFGAFIAIFLIVLFLIVRGRVLIPAKRIAERKPTVFEPAGAEAEITFDEPEAAAAPQKKNRKKERKKNRKADAKAAREETANQALVVGDLEIEQEVRELEPAHQDAPIESVEPASEREKSTAPFAGLFAKTREADPAPASANEQAAEEFYDDGVHIEYAETGPAGDDAPAAEVAQGGGWAADEPGADERERYERERLAYERAEEERRLAQEEAARARAEADEERRRAQQVEAQADAEREAAFERRKAEAALEQRLHSMAAMQRKLSEKADTLSSDTAAARDRLGAEIERRFAALSEELMQKLGGAATELNRLSANLRSSVGDSAIPADALSAISQEIAATRAANETALARLSERIDALSEAAAAMPGGQDDLHRLNKLLAERATPAVAGILQLGELVRSALPAERYAFDRRLANGASVDCLITPPGGGPPFAIDANFPVEAFEAYARADDAGRDAAATRYRRAILRHMIYIAEKLIAADETADFAILFAPSDIIFNDLHQRFSDIVQDGYRARIWIVSPTSLMATLHMIGAAASNAFARDTATKDAASAQLKDEVANLSAQVRKMEATLEEAHTGLRQTTAPATTDPVAAPGRLAAEDPVTDESAKNEALEPTQSAPVEASDEEGGEENPSPDNVVRRPFPLR